MVDNIVGVIRRLAVSAAVLGVIILIVLFPISMSHPEQDEALQVWVGVAVVLVAPVMITLITAGLVWASVGWVCWVFNLKRERFGFTPEVVSQIEKHLGLADPK